MEKKQEIQTPPTLSIWEGFRHVSPGMLKEIKGGNLNGKTDINPVWRFRALTERFGPVGFGWNVREVERWTSDCAGEIGAFVKVELRICMDGTWSEPIEGTGGSKLCGKGRGDGINDEAWKMATTDAISVACKALGMAADVYTGQQSHADDDQKKSGGDYGSKYESRNYGQKSTRSYQTGNGSTQGSYRQNSPQSAPYGGEYPPAPSAPYYQAPPPGDPNYVQPSGQRNPNSKVCEVHDVMKGRARRLIDELAKHDYDDPQDWNAGLAWLRNEVVLRPGAEEAIVRLAVEKRNENQSEAARRALS